MKYAAMAICALGFWSSAVAEDSAAFETFNGNAQERWSFIADGVMGGVSQGQAVIGQIDGENGVRLTGNVSTQNNGGFIQVRRMLPDGFPTGTTGLEMDVRGNGQDYFVFIRTAEMTRPWYYYNAGFKADTEWATVTLPLKVFVRSHAHLSEQIDPTEIISVGIFAYGSDYQADVMVREIRLF